MVPRDWLDGEPSESELEIRTHWGNSLCVIGLDKPQRMEGSPWDGGVIDEIANCKPGIWDANIRPALADRRGWCMWIGVPDKDSPGQIDYQRTVQKIHNRELDDWQVYSWSMEDVQPPEEVEAMRQSMDADLFRQEVHGEFVLNGGIAFPAFSFDRHVRPQAYNADQRLIWSLDFNVNPMCSGLMQCERDGTVRVLREVVLSDSDTNTTCTAVIELCEQQGWSLKGIEIHGDPTGSARDTTSGTSDWAIIRDRMAKYSPVMRVARRPWPIKDTLNALRGRLMSADGKAHMLIDPSCRRLINDLQTLLWPSDLESGHCVSWLRYYCVEAHGSLLFRDTDDDAVVSIQ